MNQWLRFVEGVAKHPRQTGRTLLSGILQKEESLLKMQMPVTILNTNTKRDQGKKAQLGNITAAKVGRGGALG